MDRRPLLDRWNEVDALFSEVLDIPPAKRRPFLVKRCGDDEELLETVLALLEDDRTTRDILDRGDHPSRPRLADVLTEAEAEERKDDLASALPSDGRIGAFRLLRELGRGGSGTVYLAERADGAFEHRVAIKLLRRGLDTDDILERFRAERQILASLDHPNIARLLDGGATEDGRPYLVMELVEGRPIVEYLDGERATTVQRLRLFAQVVRAVQHAHGKLIVHRDIKSSNILVTDDGTPKLLDFGIAKLLDDSDSGAVTPRTRTGMRLMTPEYASPEQMRGAPVTTASDAYQLGLLLYRVLAGCRPYRKEPEKARGFTRWVQEQDPIAASAAFALPAEERGPGQLDPEALARLRRTDPRRLRARLRGDLDIIMLKAVHPDPDQRYASVGELADDIERHLDGRPVSARPDTWEYRVRKFVVRRPGVVAGLCLAMLALAGYSFSANRHAERLELERNRAQVEAARAEGVSDFLMHLFEANDPDREDGQIPTAFELLERGEARAAQLDDQPATQAQMLDVIAGMYSRLGMDGQAEPLFRQALALRRELHPEPHVDLAGTLDRLGALLERAGRRDEAEALLTEAVEVAQMSGARTIEADSHNDLGLVLQGRGDHVGAEAAHRRALAIRLDELGPRHHQVGTSLHNIALALESQERFEEAEALYREALETKRDFFGSEHSSVTLTLTTLGRLYDRMGRDDEGEPLLREALAINRRRLGSAHPRLALDLNDLGSLLSRRGDYDEAIVVFQEALAIREAALGENHENVAISLNNLAITHSRMDNAVEGGAFARRALGIAREAWGNDHLNTLIFAHNLASYDSVAAAEKEALLRESAEGMRRVLPEGHVLPSRPLVGLGKLLLETDRAAEAEPHLRAALALREDAASDETEVREARDLLRASLTALGRTEEAEALADTP